MRRSVILACIICVTIGALGPKRNRCRNGSSGCSVELKLHRRDIGSEGHANTRENTRDNMEDDLQLIGALDRIYNRYSGLYPQSQNGMSNNDVGNKVNEGRENEVKNTQSSDIGHDSMTSNGDTEEGGLALDKGESDIASLGYSRQKNVSMDNGKNLINSTENMEDLQDLLDMDTTNDRIIDNKMESTGSSIYHGMENANTVDKNVRQWMNIDDGVINESSKSMSKQHSGNLANGNDINKNNNRWRIADMDIDGNNRQKSENFTRSDMYSNITNTTGSNWKFWQKWGTVNIGNNYHNGIKYRWQTNGEFGTSVGDSDNMGYVENNWRNKQRSWNNNIWNRYSNRPSERYRKWRVGKPAETRNSGNKNIARNWIDTGHASNLLRTLVVEKNDGIEGINTTVNDDYSTDMESVQQFYS